MKRLVNFGYADSKTPITLHQFRSRSLRQYEASSVDSVQGTFLRLIRGQTPTAEEALYGSDLDAMQVSEFPNASCIKQIRSEMRTSWSKWDLRLLPIHPHSILATLYDKGEVITGVSRPWVYCGSPLSSFAWHAEDHYLYSLNYLHQGKAKVWFGCPGDSHCKVEEVMRSEMPLLYEKHRDLHHHLVTFLDPEILKSHGVPVYRVEQNPGELVVTFPKAYHAGFNSGFNIAEAVNVACEDWLSYGVESQLRYTADRRDPVFSVDALIWELAWASNVPAGRAQCLVNQLKRMRGYWKGLPVERVSMRTLVGCKRGRRPMSGTNDEMIKCDVCRRLCFVVAIQMGSTFLCHDHYNGSGTVLENISEADIDDRILDLSPQMAAFEEWHLEVTSLLRSLMTPGISVVALTKSGRTVRTPSRFTDGEKSKKKQKLRSPSEEVFELLDDLQLRGEKRLGLNVNHPELCRLNSERLRIKEGVERLNRFLSMNKTIHSVEDVCSVWHMRHLISSADNLPALASFTYSALLVHSKHGMIKSILEEAGRFLSLGELRLIRKRQ